MSPLLSSDLLLAQNVPPKAGTPGVAQDSTPAPTGAAQPQGSPFGGMMMLLPLMIVMVLMFVFSGRRQKKEAAARSALKKGDRVMTNAGLVGELVEMDDRLAKIKVAPGVTVQFVANTVSPFVDPAERAAPKELKEAKAVSDKK